MATYLKRSKNARFLIYDHIPTIRWKFGESENWSGGS